MKKIFLIGAGTLLALVAALAIVPAFIDLGSFKATYLPLVEEAIHRRVDVGQVRLQLLPTPSIRLSTLKVSDTEQFPDNTFFSAEEIRLRLKFWPLLSGRFEPSELVLDKPVVSLLKLPDGSFNYADIARKKPPAGPNRGAAKPAPPSVQRAAALPLLLPARLRIRDGRFKLETRGQKPVEIDDVDLYLDEFSPERPFAYRASLNYPGLKTVSLEGNLSYREEGSELQVIDNRLRVRDLTLPIDGRVTRLTTVPRVDLTAAGSGIDAKPVFDVLSVFGLAPADTDVDGPLDLRITVNGPSNSLVTQVQGRFNGVKVHGKRALRGTLNGDILIRLPLGKGDLAQRLQGNGKLVAQDGELTNVNMVEKIQRVTGLIGLSKEARREATTFKSMESDFVVGGGRVDFQRLYLINPQLEINGGGNMTLDRLTLDIRLDAALAQGASARTGAGRASFFKDAKGRVVVPLRITGRVEDPEVNLDKEKVFQRGIGENVSKGLGSFFKNLFRSR